ncbi:MAG TPA: pyridoxal-dependent decarboxylase [Terriglobales bacterium]|jgi:glutamate/tyrosine decarboxylase-like PLP-dependent enzyme
MRSLDISPEEFRRLAQKVVELSTEYVDSLNSRATFPSVDGTETEGRFHAPRPDQGIGAETLAALTDIANYSRIQNGRFFGYVLGSGEPVAAVADLFASVLNQNLTAWRSGPAAITIERTVVEWIAQALGCDSFVGNLTGGGSSANLAGLAMAREAKLAVNEIGLAGQKRCAVYMSREAHMSIGKSVALLGMGRENLRLIDIDDEFRMIPTELDQAIAKDEANGLVPVAIVASAGTVNTGAIDPLVQISEIAKRHACWFHIDGAYGALAAIAAPERFAGLNLADSISLDPHKWLYQPLDCGCLLYRDSQVARRTFSHTGDYAKSLATDPIEGFEFFDQSIELSRRFRALKLWLSLRYHGFTAFRNSIREDLNLAQLLARSIQSNDQLDLLAPVPLSAVCFRFRGTGHRSNADLDNLNVAILKRMLSRGRVYLSNATIRGTFALRACIVNHRTTEADVHEIVHEVLTSANEILAHN